MPDLHHSMCGCSVCCCKLRWLAATGWMQPLCHIPLLLWCCFSCGAIHDADCMRDWRVWLLGLVWLLTETSIYGILFFCPLLIQSLLSKNDDDTTESWLWRHEGLSLRSLCCSWHMRCLMAAAAIPYRVWICGRSEQAGTALSCGICASRSCNGCCGKTFPAGKRAALAWLHCALHRRDLTNVGPEVLISVSFQQ